MSRRIGGRGIMLVLLMVAPAPGLVAQASTARGISLSEAVELAVSSSSRLRGAEAAIEAGVARRSEARTGRLPALALEASYMRLEAEEPAEIPLPDPPRRPGSITLGDSIENSYDATLSLRQPIFTGGEITAGIEGADYAVAASRGGYEWERSGVELEARTAYWKLIEAGLRVEAIEERLRQVELNLENMESRLAAGVVTKSALLTVEMKLAEARLRLLRARNGRELNVTRLALMTGLSADTDLRPTTTLESAGKSEEQPPPGESEVGRLIRDALANRGDLAALRAELNATRASKSRARGGWFPKLFLAGEYSYARPNRTSFPVKDAFESSWRVGIVGRIELGDMPRVYHESSRREAEVRAAAARLQAAEDHVQLAVREAYLAYRSSYREVELARIMVTQAEESMDDTRGRVENGVALNEDLLEAQATLLEARLALTSARTGRRIAHDRLIREIGINP